MKIVKENPRIRQVGKGKDKGYFEAVYYEDGKRYRWFIPMEFAGTSRRREDYIRGKIAGLTMRSACPTLKQWALVEYIALKKETLAAGTIRATEKVFERYLEGLGAKALDRITQEDWSRVAVAIQQERHLKPVSRNNIRGRIVSLIKFAREKYSNVESPFDIISTWEKASYEQRSAYTEEEYAKMYTACASDEERALLEVASRVGLRKSELCLITKDNLTEDNGDYYLTVKEHFINAKALGSASKIVPGRKCSQDALRILIPADLAEHVKVLEKPAGYYRMDHMLERITLQAFGKSSNSWHAFRHLAGTRLASKTSLQNTSKILGHANPKSTFRYYTLTDNAAREVAALL
jgi:integrase